MKRKKRINIKNLIFLCGFSLFSSVLLLLAMSADRKRMNEEMYASSLSSSEPVPVLSDREDTDDYRDTASSALSSSTVSVSAKEATAILEKTVFTVSEYETPVSMYTSATVNVRSGAGTDYDRVGKLSWGSQTTVTGVTDNGWYEVLYGDMRAFIKGDYMVSELPGIPYLFVGDSRTVQMKMAVGSTDKAYIAEIGEGYSYFKNTALPQIPQLAGTGTVMIINFGVNDLANAGKYITLVNNNIEAWTNAGMSVYYAAVTPVGSGTSVTNSQIEAFNLRLQTELDPRVHYLDGYTYLTQTGFSSGDGLHYSADTYRSLYSYYMSVIEAD